MPTDTIAAIQKPNLAAPCVVRRLLVRWGMRPHDEAPPEWDEWFANVIVGDLRARTFDAAIGPTGTPIIDRAGSEQRDVLDDIKPGCPLDQALEPVLGDQAAALAQGVCDRARDGRPLFVEVPPRADLGGFALAFVPLRTSYGLRLTGIVAAAGPC
jgi:hypothetical protein